MRMTISFPDAEYRKLQALARAAQQRPNDMLVLLAREELERRLTGEERARRFREAMEMTFGRLPEDEVRALDARGPTSRRRLR